MFKFLAKLFGRTKKSNPIPAAPASPVVRRPTQAPPYRNPPPIRRGESQRAAVSEPRRAAEDVYGSPLHPLNPVSPISYSSSDDSLPRSSCSDYSGSSSYGGDSSSSSSDSCSSSSSSSD